MTLLSDLRAKAGGVHRGVWPKSYAYHRLRKIQYDGSLRSLILQRLATDRRPILETLVDKVAVRQFVRSVSPDIVLPVHYQEVDNVRDLNPTLWPEECVIKPTHGSGAVLFVTKEPREGVTYGALRAPFRWDSGPCGMLAGDINRTELEQLGNQWLSSNYEHWRPKYPEWAYARIPRGIVVEELLGSRVPDMFREYRLHCFHGQVVVARYTHLHGSGAFSETLNRSGMPIPARLTSDRETRRVSHVPGKNWNRLIQVAEDLAANIDYVRVDLYDDGERVIFSEMTVYPNGGNHDFIPAELSRLMAEAWLHPERVSDISHQIDRWGSEK